MEPFWLFSARLLLLLFENFFPDPKGQHGRIRLDLSRSKKVLGYSPQYPLEKGLKDYLDRSRRFGFWA